MNFFLTKTTEYFTYLLILFFMSSCGGGVEAEGDVKGRKKEKSISGSANGATESSNEDQYWTQPQDTIQGYQVFANTYEIWANSFNYWFSGLSGLNSSGENGATSYPLNSPIAASLVSETNYTSNFGLKVYFGLNPDANSIDQKPVLVMVAAEMEVSDDSVYFNDAADNGYLVFEPFEQNATWMDESEARTYVTAWKDYIDELSGFGSVYSYTFSKDHVTNAINGTDSLRIRFGLHTVSPSDTTYSFANKYDTGSSTYKVEGFLVPSVILQNEPQEGGEETETYFLNFSSPCPRWCGINGEKDLSKKKKL